MDRRLLAAAGVSVTLVALGGTDAYRAGAATNPPLVVSLEKPAQTPFALFGEYSVGYGLYTGLDAAEPGGFTFDDVGSYISGTDIAPSGRAGLIVAGGDTVGVVTKVTVHTEYLDTVSLASFVGEGNDAYTPAAESVAMTEKTALVAVGEQGVIQLRRSGKHWKVDTRVQSSGQNEAGDPHQPGFIRLPATSNHALQYHAVAISQVPLPNGELLGLAIDRSDSTLQVIEGVGTAHPTVVGHLNADAVGYIPSATGGTGGIRFSPATATRAAIATSNGFGILDLSNPAHPKVLGQTVVSGGTNGLAVAPDGDHVAAISGQQVLIYRGLAKTRRGNLPFTDAIKPSHNDGDTIDAVAFAADGELLVTRVGSPGHPSPGGLNLLNVYSGVDKDNITVHGEAELDQDPARNTLSVAPTVGAPQLEALVDPTVKAGHKADLKLHVSGGVGHFTGKVIDGKLPKGLTLDRLRISGTTHDKGKAHVVIRALNQYGGAAIKSYTITVK